jgi:hypothetical protein
MIIVRLLSPGPWLVGTTKVYSGVGADIVMESIPPRTGVREWTNIPQCAGTTDTSTWDPIWKAESIVNASATTQQLTYPKTSVGAWLCDTSTTTMNNTSAQGYLFYKRVSTGLQRYTVNAIYSCQGAEGVGGGNTKADLSGFSGLTAIENDMKNTTTGCVKHQ